MVVRAFVWRVFGFLVCWGNLVTFEYFWLFFVVEGLLWRCLWFGFLLGEGMFSVHGCS